MDNSSPCDPTAVNDQQRRLILTTARAIAIVGHSPKPHRPSYQIAQFLRSVGYQVYPVNPGVKQIDGNPCYARLSDIPDRIDIVNVFRRADALPSIVAETIELYRMHDSIWPQTLWTQLDIVALNAAEKAMNAGLTVVMDACIKVDYLRLLAGSLITEH